MAWRCIRLYTVTNHNLAMNCFVTMINLKKIKIIILLFCGMMGSCAFGQKVSALMKTSPNKESYIQLKDLSASPKLLLHYSVFRKNNAGGQSQTLMMAIPEPDSIVIGKTYTLPHPNFLLFYDASALDMRAGMNKVGPGNINGTIKVYKYEAGKSMKLEFEMKGETDDKTKVFLKDKRVFKPNS